MHLFYSMHENCSSNTSNITKTSYNH